MTTDNEEGRIIDDFVVWNDGVDKDGRYIDGTYKGIRWNISVTSSSFPGSSTADVFVGCDQYKISRCFYGDDDFNHFTVYIKKVVDDETYRNTKPWAEEDAKQKLMYFQRKQKYDEEEKIRLKREAKKKEREHEKLEADCGKTFEYKGYPYRIEKVINVSYCLSIGYDRTNFANFANFAMNREIKSEEHLRRLIHHRAQKWVDHQIKSMNKTKAIQ